MPQGDSPCHPVCNERCPHWSAKTPPLSRQDATLSEQTYPLRHKNKKITKWEAIDRLWTQANKENIPPKDVKQKDPQSDVKEEEEHDAVVVKHQ